MKFVPDEPVMVMPVESALALTYSKFATATLSPVVWSEPAATPRLIAVTVTPAARINVSLPAPASIEVSEPR